MSKRRYFKKGIDKKKYVLRFLIYVEKKFRYWLFVVFVVRYAYDFMSDKGVLRPLEDLHGVPDRLAEFEV